MVTSARYSPLTRRAIGDTSAPISAATRPAAGSQMTMSSPSPITGVPGAPLSAAPT